MTEKIFFNLLKKKFTHLKISKIKTNQDLLKDHILDSLELMKFVSILEKKKIFSLKEYAKKENNFKISRILNFINKK
jgi:acyl carrier protein|tara:strand:- start:36 stop:266 length:231 start_codon:yes stop_codon:yes gene_type:complete